MAKRYELENLAREALRGGFIKGTERGSGSADSVAQHRSGEKMVRVTVKVNRLAVGHDGWRLLQAALLGIRAHYQWPTDDEGNER